MTRPLIVALHGVGSSAADMAAALAPLGAVAEIIALDGTESFDGGGPGRQWFSLAGVTEADRPARVSGAIAPLLARLDRLARDRGVDREALVLLGFSQGAIMTLALVAQGLHAGRAIAIAGRLAAPVAPVARPASLLVVCDRTDPVMPAPLSAAAAAALSAAGHRVDQVTTTGIGHSIGAATLHAIADWLAATASVRATASNKD